MPLGLVIAMAGGCSTGGNLGNSESSAESASSESPSGVSVEVSPDADIGNGDEVTVSVGGIEDERFAYVAQCLSDQTGLSTLDGCALWRAGKLEVDVSGHAEATYPLHAFIRRGLPIETNCAEAECVLAVLNVNEEIVATAPISWDPSAPLPPAPQLTVALNEEGDPGSADDLISVTVSGTGFMPGESVPLVQCAVPRDDDVVGGSEDVVAISGRDCVYDGGTEAVADDAGTFSVELSVLPRLVRSNAEEVDCRGEASECLIARPTVQDHPESRLAAVQFALPPTG